MDKLDVSRWKEFKVGDLLTKVKTKKVPFKALDLPVNPTDNCYLPLVAAGVDNQGRSRYVDPKYATVLHGCLTVSANGANSGATFYQDSDFSILQDAYALELVDKYKSMGVDNIYLFLAAVIRRGLINNDWSNKATWTRVQKTIIMLPVISSGEPDWQYMDSYIAKLTTLAYQEVSLLERGKEKSEPLNVSGWQEFKIGQLFDISKGHRLTKSNMIPGKINYVGASADNNGVTHHIGNKDHIFDAGSISVTYNGSVGQVFYQNEPFWATDDVNVLTLKEDQSVNVKLFLMSCLKQSGKRYGFADKWTVSKMKKDVIKLPVDINGNPDWLYMNKHVVLLRQRVQHQLCQYRLVF